MKLKSILFPAFGCILCGMTFMACSDDSEEPKPIIDPVYYSYILNEGSWPGNNANISLFDPVAGELIQSDVYQAVNGRKMGELANAMIEDDDQIYVVLNGSKYVARLDATCKEQARYTFAEAEGAPRCIDVEDGFVYVTQYGGQVSKLDAKTMTRVATFNGGDNLEGIVADDGKLYVANGWKGIDTFNNELLVIDAETMKQTGSIKVVENPGKLYEIDDKIYLLSVGNYVDVEASLQLIDPATNTAKPITSADKITEGNDGLIYGVRSTYDAEWKLTNSFFVYNPRSGRVEDTSFLRDAPDSFSTVAIYLLEVDENTGYIYVGTSDYVSTGTIYQFDKTGKLLHKFDSGGINPNAMIFID